MAKKFNKNLIKLLDKYNIPFKIENGKLYVYPCGPNWKDYPTSEREAYKIIGYYRYGNGIKARATAKKLQNKRIRKFPVEEENRPIHKPDRWMWD